MANYYNKNTAKYNWGNGWTKKGVSEQQASYLEALSNKTGIELTNTEKMNRGIASGLINELQRLSYGDQNVIRYLARDYADFVKLGK